MPQASEGDEFEARVTFDGDEGVALDLTGFEEARVCGSENLIAIARMGDELKCTFRHRRDESVYNGEVEGAGGKNAYGTASGDKAFLRDDTAEAGLKASEKHDLGAPSIRRIGRGIYAPERLEGVTYGINPCGAGSAKYWPENQRKHVHVFVRVDMREVETVALKECDLCSGFSLDLGRANTRGVESLQEIADGRVERARCLIDQRWDCARISCGEPVDEDDVAANAECGNGEGHLHGFLSGCGPCHERRAGENFSGVKFEDGAVDTGRHPEIVGIDDEAGHGDSLSIPARTMACYVVFGIRLMKVRVSLFLVGWRFAKAVQ